MTMNVNLFAGLRTIVLVCLAVGVGVGIGQPAHGQTSAPVVEQSVPVVDVAAIEAAINRHTLGTWWGAVLVSQKGEVKFAKGYGFANDSLHPIDADTLFDIASCSKAVTAAAVLALVDEGKLSLDDTVEKFFPKMRGPASKHAGKVTVRQLLGHTAGIDDMAAMQRLDFEDRDEAVALAMASIKAPGKRFEYANGGYVVASAIVEVVSGKTFEEAVEALVFAPAGMTETGFLNSTDLNFEHAAARVLEYNGQENRLTIREDGWGWGLRGAGGVLTTMNDLAKWDAALSDDRVLSEASRSAMFTRGTGGYGLGWFVEKTARGTRRVHHSGGTRGFRCWFVRLPDEHTFVAVLTNTRSSPHEIAKIVEDTIFPPPVDSGFGSVTLGDRDEGEWGISVTEEILVWRNATESERKAAGNKVTEEITGLVLERATDGAKVMELWLSQGGVVRLTQELENAISEGAEGADSAAASRPSVLSIMSRAVGATATTFGSLREGLSITVRDRYQGANGDGTVFEDVRPTLTIVDEEKGIWPVIVRMDAQTAASMGEAMQAAAGGKGSGRK